MTKTYSEETKEANEARKEAEDKANRAKIEADSAKIEKENAKIAKKKAEEQAKIEVNAAKKKAEEAKEAAEKAQEEVIAANQKVAYITAQCTTNAFYFIGSDRNTDACTADQNTIFTFTACNCICNRFAVCRVVYGFFGECTEVFICNIVFFQIADNLFHQRITAMIAT